MTVTKSINIILVCENMIRMTKAIESIIETASCVFVCVLFNLVFLFLMFWLVSIGRSISSSPHHHSVKSNLMIFSYFCFEHNSPPPPPSIPLDICVEFINACGFNMCVAVQSAPSSCYYVLFEINSFFSSQFLCKSFNLKPHTYSDLMRSHSTI